METVLTIIGLIIALIGLLYAIKTYHRQFLSKPDEEMEHLKVQFKATQTLSLQVQNNLEKFIQENNAGSNLFFIGVTYNGYLKQMKLSHEKYLSDNLLNNIG